MCFKHNRIACHTTIQFEMKRLEKRLSRVEMIEVLIGSVLRICFEWIGIFIGKGLILKQSCSLGTHWPLSGVRFSFATLPMILLRLYTY